MSDNFEREVSFTSKPKVKIAGELKGEEIGIGRFFAAPFLSLFLDEDSHSKQLRQPLLLETLSSTKCLIIAYKNKVFVISEDNAHVKLSFGTKTKSELVEYFNNKLGWSETELVGNINNRQIIFDKELPHDTLFHTGWHGLDTAAGLRGFLPERELLLQTNTPVFIGTAIRNPYFAYRNKVVEIEGIKYRNASPAIIVPEEDALLVKHFVLKQEHAFDKMKAQVEAFERFEKALKSKREPLPEEVKMYVWRRDEGKCVLCSNQKNLEFDHIIPLSKGGSNTERNIQLLCEACNRQKSNNI